MKLRIGVFFGSRSVEHEISVITAQQVMKVLEEKYDVIPIYISKEGKFYSGKLLKNLENFKNIPKLLDKCINLNFSLDSSRNFIYRNSFNIFRRTILERIDIAFPILHGTFGEDGTIQGVFEMMNIPYIGSNVLSSSITMDKIFTKFTLKANNFDVLPFHHFYSKEFFNNKEKIMNEIEEKLTHPLIVKPSNLGSSIGIEIAKTKKELELAIESASFLSQKIIVEKFLDNITELNISVIGDYEKQECSSIERLISNSKILSYNEKYKNNEGFATAERELPARIDKELEKTIHQQAKELFKIFNCSGLIRIDFMFDNNEQKLYINEINPIPGSLAFYLWENSNLSFAKLLDKLIEISFKRKREQEKITSSFKSNILNLGNGIKGIKK